MTQHGNSDKPYISNYSPLKEWLDRIDARCMRQIPVGDPKHPSAYLEMWMAASRVFVVEVRSNKNGWNIYTGADTNRADETFADAEARLGIKGA